MGKHDKPESPAPVVAPAFDAPQAATPAVPEVRATPIVPRPNAPEHHITKRAALAKSAEELWDKTPDVIFVDAARREWPARVKPLPINKHPVVNIPGVRDMRAEYDKIDAMPLQDRVGAFQELQERNSKGQSAIMVDAKRFDNVCEFKGVPMYQFKRPDGRDEPLCNLLVNTATSDDYEEWVTMHNMRHRDYVGVTAVGRQIPHWKFKNE